MTSLSSFRQRQCARDRLAVPRVAAAANLSPASINRALATLRSVSKLARMLGVVHGGWYLEVPGVKAERQRDTRGPAVGDIRRMLEAIGGDTETETRDYAIVVTLYCLGLRVSELCGLLIEETDLVRGTAWIRGKGRREKELVPLPAAVVDALRRYLAHRGDGRGPLFLSRSRRIAGDGSKRMHTNSVLRIVDELGRRVGVRVWPHGRATRRSLRRSSAGSKPASGLTRSAPSRGIERSGQCSSIETSTIA